MKPLHATPTITAEYQHLLELADHRRTGTLVTAAQSRGILDTLRHVSTALTKARLDYALGGALALGVYTRPRATADIDIISLDNQRDELKQVLQDAGLLLRQDLPYQLTFIDPATAPSLDQALEVDILLGALDPEESAASDPTHTNILGVSTNVIKPEYLLWMLCDRRQHQADAISLIKSGKVDIRKLQEYLKYTQDSQAEHRLNQLLEVSDRETSSGNYSTSVQQRQQRRRK